MNQEHERRYFTTSELAQEAGRRGLLITPTRIRQLCAAGDIRAERPGRDWLIPTWEGERWLRERQDNRE